MILCFIDFYLLCFCYQFWWFMLLHLFFFFPSAWFGLIFFLFFLDYWGESFNYWFNYLLFFPNIGISCQHLLSYAHKFVLLYFHFYSIQWIIWYSWDFSLTYRSSRYVLFRAHVFEYFCVIYNDRFLCFHGNRTTYFAWFYFVFTFVKICSMVENMVYLGTCFIHV